MANFEMIEVVIEFRENRERKFSEVKNPRKSSKRTVGLLKFEFLEFLANILIAEGKWHVEKCLLNRVLYNYISTKYRATRWRAALNQEDWLGGVVSKRASARSAQTFSETYFSEFDHQNINYFSKIEK